MAEEKENTLRWGCVWVFAAAGAKKSARCRRFDEADNGSAASANIRSLRRLGAKSGGSSLNLI